MKHRASPVNYRDEQYLSTYIHLGRKNLANAKSVILLILYTQYYIDTTIYDSYFLNIFLRDIKVLCISRQQKMHKYDNFLDLRNLARREIFKARKTEFEVTCRRRQIEGRAVLRDTCGSTRPSPRDAFSLLSLLFFRFSPFLPLPVVSFFSASSHIPVDIIVNIDHGFGC